MGRRVAQDLECQRQQRVAGQDRRRFVEGDVDRRLAAPRCSSSMQGRSSWMSECTWTHSTARPARMELSRGTSNRSPTAQTSNGRKRFAAADGAWRIARNSRSLGSGGIARSSSNRLSSIAAVRPMGGSTAARAGLRSIVLTRSPGA
jgi:hypothetical protein